VGSGAFGMTAMLTTIAICHCRAHASVRQRRRFGSARRPAPATETARAKRRSCPVLTRRRPWPKPHIAIEADVRPTDLRVDTRALGGRSVNVIKR
jgi:hypothetical protein